MKKIVCLLILCCFLTACAALAETPTVPETTDAGLRISPLPETIDLSHLDNCTVAVSLKEGDAYVDDTGAMQMKVTVYTYELFDLVDISQLKAGDTLTIRQQDVPVTSVERDESGLMQINGGLEQGGYNLVTYDDGVFFEILPSDAKYWQELGEATMRVSPDFIYTDSSDLDKGEVVYYPGDFLVEGTGIDYNFSPNNTTIVIENERIVAMNRVYIP